MKTQFLKFALLAVFCIGTAVANAQASGYTEVRNANVVKEPIASLDVAAKAVEKGKVIVILDGIEISQEKFKSLNPNNIEKMELLKGESMKVLYGEKGADGVLRITSKRENSQEAQVSGFTSVRRGNVTTETNVPVHIRGSVANPQTKLSEEAVKVVKELKQVDTKGLSSDEAQTVMKVLNQIKKQHSDNFVAITAVGETKAPATPAKDGEAKLGSKSNPMVFDMTTGMGMKPIRIKYMLDGREVTSPEYFDMLKMRGKSGGIKSKHLRDKESLAKYNAQGYDEVWIIETIKGKKSTEQSPASAVKFADPAKKGEARVGTAENPMDISMLLTSGKQVRAKYILDGREITSSEYWDILMIRDNKGLKTKMFKDKESLAKYNAQGYDEVWVLETVKVEKSTTPRVTKFKQNGNQVSFRIEIPKSADRAKQKVDINYEL